MAQAPNEPDRVSTIVFALAGLGVLVVLAYAGYSHFHKMSEAEAHEGQAKIEELEDENAQLEREKREAEDTLNRKRHCVEDADSLQEAKDCF